MLSTNMEARVLELLRSSGKVYFIGVRVSLLQVEITIFCCLRWWLWLAVIRRQRVCFDVFVVDFRIQLSFLYINEIVYVMHMYMECFIIRSIRSGQYVELLVHFVHLNEIREK